MSRYSETDFVGYQSPRPLFFKIIYYLCLMENVIRKFLDDYLGDEVFYEKELLKNEKERYYIYSKKNQTLIIFFDYSDGGEFIRVFRGNVLTCTVSRFFDMDPYDVTKVIRDWFGDKHNLKMVSDLMKIVS